jgi:hypothetical protein
VKTGIVEHGLRFIAAIHRKRDHKNHHQSADDKSELSKARRIDEKVDQSDEKNRCSYCHSGILMVAVVGPNRRPQISMAIRMSADAVFAFHRFRVGAIEVNIAVREYELATTDQFRHILADRLIELEARKMRELMSCSDNPRKLASTFKRQIVADTRWDGKPISPRGIDQLFAMVGGPLIRVGNFDLVVDSLRGMRLRVRTDSLLQALWWQLGTKLAGDISFRECEFCHQHFEVGPTAGKRTDSQFCCREHRIRHNSLKRTPRGK